MTISNRLKKPKFTYEQWVDFAYSQLLSDEWNIIRKELFDYVKNERIISSDIEEKFFMSSILGSLLQLLTLVATKYDKGLGFIVNLKLDEYINCQETSIGDNIRASYNICNNKVAELGDLSSGVRAIAIGCGEHLGLEESVEFVNIFEVQLNGLAMVLLDEISHYNLVF